VATGLSVFVSTPVQLFYAWRVFIRTYSIGFVPPSFLPIFDSVSKKSPWLPGFIAIVAITSFGMLESF
jgi:hypothetical protein